MIELSAGSVRLRTFAVLRPFTAENPQVAAGESTCSRPGTNTRRVATNLTAVPTSGQPDSVTESFAT